MNPLTSPPTALQQYHARQAEYEVLLQALQTHLYTPSTFNEHYIETQPHSTLTQEQDRAQRLLQAVINEEHSPAKPYSSLSDHLLEVVGIGHQSRFDGTRQGSDGGTYTVADTTTASEQVQAFQTALVDIGGRIRVDRMLPLTQVLKYYGLKVPSVVTSGSVARLIKDVREKRAIHRLDLEQRLPLNNLIGAQEQSILQAALSEWLPDGAVSVLQVLVDAISPAPAAQQLQESPATYLAELVNTPLARDLARHLLQTLQWHGADNFEDTVPDIGARLVLYALCVWHDLLPGETPDTIAGYDLRQIDHHGKSYGYIRQAFRRHLLNSVRATDATAQALLARLCLPWFPVEFQVADIPDDLPYATSMVWVNFVHGAHLAHALDPLLLQRLTFQQIVDLPLKKSEKASGPMLELITLTRVPAATLWANATGVIEPGNPQHENAQYAMEQLERHGAGLNEAITQLSLNPPERLCVAREQLARALSTDMLDVQALRNMRVMRTPPRHGRRSKRSILDTPLVAQTTWFLHDVYASGGLTPDTRWYVTTDGKTASRWVSLNAEKRFESGFLQTSGKGKPITGFALNATLPDIETLFDEQLTRYLADTRTAYTRLISSQLASLPWADRQALEFGQVRILALRKPARDVAAHNETAKHRAPLWLRMGFVLHVSHGDTRRFIECLPRAGVIRLRPDLSAAHIGARFTPALSPKRGRTRSQLLPRWTSRGLPIDWQAHLQGTAPKQGASCVAILDALDDIPDLYALHMGTAATSSSNARLQQIAHYICTHHFYLDEKKLRKEAWGITHFERDRDDTTLLDILKGFIPFWGSLEDLQSDQFGDRAMGLLGLVIDIVSFAVPLGKFAAGSLRLAANAGKMGVRTTLTSMTRLSGKLLLANLKNLNPLDGLSDLLRGSGRTIKAADNALAHLESRTLFNLKKLVGNTDSHQLIDRWPTIGDAGIWKPLKDTDQLISIRGINDVHVRQAGKPPRLHLVDPLTDRPYGPALCADRHDVSPGRSHYSVVRKSDEHVFIEIPEQARVQQLFEADGRTTVLIEDVSYRLDCDELRRVDIIDMGEHLRLLPCRVRRAPQVGHCMPYYVTGEPAAVPRLGSFDKSKGYATWFGDRTSLPGTIAGQRMQFMALDSQLYRFVNERPVLYTGDLARVGLPGRRLIPRQEIQATVQFRQGIFARLNLSGTYEHIEDSQQLGAIVVPAIDESATHVFFRANTTEFYLATILKGQTSGVQQTFKRLLPAEMARGTLGAELLTVYTGSLNANNIVRIHGIEAVERAMTTMEKIAIPLGTTSNPPANFRFVKVDTSPGEALMFDHSTRVIATELQRASGLWTRSSEASQAFRERTTEIFNTLFLMTVVAPKKPGEALRIDQTMSTLQELLPLAERTMSGRNIAYAEVINVSGQREVYVSVSGAPRTTTRLPLFRHLGNSHARIGDTTYINVDFSENFPRKGIDASGDGHMLAVPLTIKDLATYHPHMTARPTSLDSESKLIRVIRDKYPDLSEIRSVNVATTMRPCESCAVVMEEFGYDGTPGALQVLWK